MNRTELVIRTYAVVAGTVAIGILLVMLPFALARKLFTERDIVVIPGNEP